MHKVVEQAGEIDVLPMDLVEFNSTGHLLIIATAQHINAVLPHLSGLTISAVCTDDNANSVLDGVNVITTAIQTIEGWLGEFLVEFESQQLKVDLVLDLSDSPIVKSTVLPLGYFAPGDNAQALAETLQQLPDLVGTFDKPKYFDYKASICAHSRRGVKGCQQCMDACPADAISSANELVLVNPSLCQGCGSCATVCPSGAMTYALPTLDVSLNRLRKMMLAYAAIDNTAPHIVIHDLAKGQLLLDALGHQLPDDIILFSIEEIGAVGMAFWLNALAYGAGGVTIWDAGSHDDHDWLELQQEIEKTNEMLAGLAFADEVVNWFAGNDINKLTEFLANTNKALAIEAATYAGLDDKRRMIKLAMHHLHQHTESTTEALVLANNSAFGEIKVNTQTCTLCMSCVSVCPVGAVLDGVDKPQLNFIEDLCVQCGLCEQACPENAIELNGRFLFDTEIVRKPRLLHEEPVFHCISCNKGFATKTMIDTMTEKLKDHHMFQGAALERLKMCEDCRVKAMVKDEQGPR
ncbi:4Fe-4S ferredoxin [Methylophaga sp. 42_25_T18]|nr:4Fe-4S ferredoxin [Methylophaga sp. 42_25_T18]OUR88374.1 4Fe-4S ferredoxin [Methylophaga sp. 42_8_T64]